MTDPKRQAQDWVARRLSDGLWTRSDAVEMLVREVQPLMEQIDRYEGAIASYRASLKASEDAEERAEQAEERVKELEQENAALRAGLEQEEQRHTLTVLSAAEERKDMERQVAALRAERDAAQAHSRNHHLEACETCMACEAQRDEARGFQQLAHGHELRAVSAEEERDAADERYAKGLASLRAVIKDRDEAQANAKQYHDALVARHGGEPVALLAELDAERAKVADLESTIDKADQHTSGLMERIEKVEATLEEAYARAEKAEQVAHHLEQMLREAETRTNHAEQAASQAEAVSESFEDALEAERALADRLREALKRIEEETEGVPEQNCLIAHGIATEALAAQRGTT